MKTIYYDFDRWTKACKDFDGPFQIQGHNSFKYTKDGEIVAVWSDTAGEIEAPGEPVVEPSPLVLPADSIVTRTEK